MPYIILVDDDEAVRVIMRMALVRMGHVVKEAGNGREAMKFCSEKEPDLMMTDIIMPEQEGIETIGAVRKKYPAVRVIAMSGGGRMSATDYLQTALAMGADAVLAKPFSSEELEALVAKVLGKAPAPGQGRPSAT
jgi:YesN/AraC family two-component response regulator